MKLPTVITGPRQSGKTTRLTELLKQDPYGVLVVFSHEYAKQVKFRFPEIADRVTSAYALERFLDGNIGRMSVNLYADELPPEYSDLAAEVRVTRVEDLRPRSTVDQKKFFRSHQK